MKCSHEKLWEIVLCHQYYAISELLPNELESFLVYWKNSIPQKSPLSLIVVNFDGNVSLDTNFENMQIIKKYIGLGVIKKFKVTNFDDDEFN